MNRRPPIHCTPCRVTYQGVRYQIEENGEVRRVTALNGEPTPMDYISGSKMAANVRRDRPTLSEPEAKLVRREASRQRRNRNARERTQAMKDLGLVRTKGGAFGGWE